MTYRGIVVSLACAFATPAEAQQADRGEAVSRLFADAADPSGPGCVVSVLHAGATVFKRAWGQANLEQTAPITPGTVFEAGSVSKQFTAAAVAILVDRGLLSLDEDIRRLLPEMRAYGTPVTVRMLLTHTSGIRNWDDLVELSGRPREDASGFTQAEVLALIARQPALNFKPGSEYLYSNSNYVLLVALVERASGKSFEDFSRQMVFAPIGLSATQWRSDFTRVIPGRATAYTPDDSGALHIDMPMEDVIGPGGLLTTVGDLQRWNTFLDNPSAEAAGWVRLLTESIGHLSGGAPIQYGFGLEHEELEGRPVVSHAGATAGYRAYLARVPSERLSAAILCNAGALNTEDIGPELLSLFMPRPEAASVSAPKVVTIPSGLGGNYRNETTGALVTLTIDDAGAHFNHGAAFVVASPDLLVSVDGARRAELQRDKHGSLTRILLSRVGNSNVALLPVESWMPSQGDLKAFTGSYHSNDVAADWDIAIDHGQLRATGPRGETFLLQPVYRDAFSGVDAYWTLEFERSRQGKIIAVRFTKTRTRAVRFERAPH